MPWNAALSPRILRFAEIYLSSWVGRRPIETPLRMTRQEGWLRLHQGHGLVITRIVRLAVGTEQGEYKPI
jgi:hypothetical protein